VKITPNDKCNPPGKLPDAELHFTGGPLEGLNLIGFGIWERRGGSGRNVTFPARQYTINGERRSFARGSALQVRMGRPLVGRTRAGRNEPNSIRVASSQSASTGRPESFDRMLPMVRRLLEHTNLAQTSTYLHASEFGLGESMRRYDVSSGTSVVAHETTIDHPLECHDETPDTDKPSKH
jgi:hypothetical protein